jgi:hypothetical protein
LPAANGGTGVNNAGTLTNASNTTITGGGTLALGGYTLTVPATGTAALLATANTFTAAQTISLSSGDVLTLNGTSANNTILRLKDDGTETAAIYTLNGANNLYLRAAGIARLLGGSATTNHLSVSTTGQVGVKNDSPSYDLDVSGTLRATGAAYLTDIRPVSDSTTAVQIKRSGGTAIVTVDTTNSRVGINGTPGAFAFDVTGTANISAMLKAQDVWANASLGVGIQPTDPSWVVDVVGNSRFTGAIKITEHLRFSETSTTPSSLSSSAEGVIYVKSDKLIVAFNDGGTVRYKYLDLTGTGVTWQHTTSAP